MLAHGKTLMEDVFHFHNIFPTIFIYVFNLYDFYIDFDGYIQMMLRTLIILYMLVLGSSLNDWK